MAVKQPAKKEVTVKIECCGGGGDGKRMWKIGHCHAHAAGSGIYGLGFIGAAGYYIQTATSFWDGVIGVLKAIVWPAFLVHKLLMFLKA